LVTWAKYGKIVQGTPMFDPENNGFLFCKFFPVNLLKKNTFAQEA